MARKLVLSFSLLCLAACAAVTAGCGGQAALRLDRA